MAQKLKIGIALAIAIVVVGAIFVMTLRIDAVIQRSEAPSVLYHRVLMWSIGIGLSLPSVMSIFCVSIIAFRMLRFIQPSLAIGLVSEAAERPCLCGGSLKWYLIVTGALVPLLLAAQAFGLLGGPWVPSTNDDWILILFYVVSQLPIVFGALISLQFPWVYNVLVDEEVLMYNYLWHDRQLSVEDIVRSTQYEGFVFLFIKKKKIPLLVWVTSPNLSDCADEKHPTD